jgi:hypothetical protein
MVIREAQREALAKSKKADFIQRLMVHFEKLWPVQVEELGAGYRSWVEAGIDAAHFYEMTREQEVARFVNLWFVWGKGFETAPENRWASEIVLDEERKGHVKIHQLCYETKMRLSARKDE